MTFEWREYFDYAKRLLDSTPKTTHLSQQQECKYRCSVSRAYYAAYNTAGDYASEHMNYKRPAEGRDHQNLADFFIKFWEDTKVIQFAEIGEELNTMRDLRHSADYRSGMKIAHSEAETCLDAAQLVPNNVSDLRSGNTQA